MALIFLVMLIAAAMAITINAKIFIHVVRMPRGRTKVSNEAMMFRNE
jgi:hypothetical protein